MGTCLHCLRARDSVYVCGKSRGEREEMYSENLRPRSCDQLTKSDHVTAPHPFPSSHPGWYATPKLLQPQHPGAKVWREGGRRLCPTSLLSENSASHPPHTPRSFPTEDKNRARKHTPVWCSGIGLRPNLRPRTVLGGRNVYLLKRCFYTLAVVSPPSPSLDRRLLR